jgi:carboxymethylenebutenolidase
MKWIRRVLLIALAALVALIAVFGVVMAVDALALDSSADVINVRYNALDGTEIGGYLAPASDAPAQPAVLMVHEWWGLNAEIAEMADILAEEGYVVLAPDTYRGRLASTVPGALALRLSANPTQVNSDMQAAFAYLAALPNVDPTRIAVMGFCYGGGVALRHAISNEQIAATINLYGDTVDDPAAFGALANTGKPLLGIFGALDQQIPISEVEAFEAALGQTSIPHTVTIYEGMPHAFVHPSSIVEAGAAQDAWAEILTFLDGTLQGSET